MVECEHMIFVTEYVKIQSQKMRKVHDGPLRRNKGNN